MVAKEKHSIKHLANCLIISVLPPPHEFFKQLIFNALRFFFVTESSLRYRDLSFIIFKDLRI